MKNFEKWEEKLRKMCTHNTNFGVIHGEPRHCNNLLCSEECELSQNQSGDGRLCSAKRLDWLYAEYIEKPVLNKYEKAFCEAVQTGWIARDKSGAIYWHRDKPSKDLRDETWYARGSAGFKIGSSVGYANPEIRFDFMKWEDANPWSIAGLLQLEVAKA